MRIILLFLLLIISFKCQIQTTKKDHSDIKISKVSKTQKDFIKSSDASIKVDDVTNVDTALSLTNVKDTLDGKVSYYGDEFHGNKTASGEVFDQNKLTAAHKTLPFGTKLLLINPKNGKSVIVTVNDRGPFVDNRVVDISKSAAKHLSILRSGVAYLQIFQL